MTNKPYDKTSIESITNYAKQLQNKRLIDFVDKKSINPLGGKGQFGQYLEKYFFGYDINSRKGVDFEHANLELKSGGVVFRKGVLVSKERLSIGLINFTDIVNETFYKSTLWNKLKNTLLVYYEFKQAESPLHYKVRVVGIHELSKNDILQIKKDWELIKTKIKNGEAHLISGGDTEFLEASTTGSRNQKSVKQPNSEIIAKPRRFALKPRYMSSVLNQMYFNNIILEGEVDMELLDNLIEKLKQYQGKSFEEVSSALFMDTSESNKARFATVSTSMVLNSLSQISPTALESWKKYDYKIKTVRMSKNRYVKESISFPKFDPENLIKETWETSKLNEYLENTKYLFIFWREEEGSYLLDRTVFWNMPAEDILEAKKVWKKTINCLKNNDLDNFPKIKDNRVCHVRPKARNSEDTVRTHLGSEMVKSTFWINANYIRESIYNS
jgi:DNA mismatch repair protein MutH